MDTITIISNEDGGIDFHGSMSHEYVILLTKGDLQRAINRISNDTIHNWRVTDGGDYLLKIQRLERIDTTFQFGLMKSKGMLWVNIWQ